MHVLNSEGDSPAVDQVDAARVAPGTLADRLAMIRRLMAELVECLSQRLDVLAEDRERTSEEVAWVRKYLAGEVPRPVGTEDTTVSDVPIEDSPKALSHPFPAWGGKVLGLIQVLRDNNLEKVADEIKSEAEEAYSGVVPKELWVVPEEFDEADYYRERLAAEEKLARWLRDYLLQDRLIDYLRDELKASPTSGGKEAAEDAAFLWKAPMLEGYVFALLKEVEYPTEREAAEWIATKSRKREPARTTMRKTYAWQNRPQKTPEPRTTNEAQSGVSPAQNADPAMSHGEVTNAVLDIEEKLHRQLVDNERDAVAWTLQQAGADDEDRDEAVRQLIRGFRSGDM